MSDPTHKPTTAIRVQEVREQRECSLHEARHIVWKEEMRAQLAAALTVDDLRVILAALIDRTSQWTT